MELTPYHFNLKDEARALKIDVLRQYEDHDLRLMFGRRENDELFRRVGEAQNRELPARLQIWLGFEILCSVVYLYDRERASRFGRYAEPVFRPRKSGRQTV